MAKRSATKQEKAARPVVAPQVKPEDFPAWNVERRKLSTLADHPNNVRTHPVGQLAHLDPSFAEHGAVKPLVVNERGQILAGHGSKDSMLHVYGDIEVPVVVARGWTEAQQRTFMLRDNAVADLSGWDKKGLGLELANLKALGLSDLKGLGFKPHMLARFAPEKTREGHSDPDAEAPPAAGPVVSRLGDVWLLGDHRLMCGDATHGDHVSALLAGDVPNLMVTDPPYGVDYDPAWRNRTEELGATSLGRFARVEGVVANDTRVDWRTAWSLFVGDVAYVWHASMFGPEVIASLEACQFERRAQVIWNKNKHAIGRGHYHWKHEPCWYVVRAGAAGDWQGSRSETTVWDIANAGGPDRDKQDTITGHGTQKPIECMARPMRNNSKAGDLVYEPFCGSGTTIIAGETLGRRVRALEIDPTYVDTAVRRWELFTKKRAILAAGELSFEVVAAARAAEQAPVAA